jgi:hypothetical protein
MPDPELMGNTFRLLFAAYKRQLTRALSTTEFKRKKDYAKVADQLRSINLDIDTKKPPRREDVAAVAAYARACAALRQD